VVLVEESTYLRTTDEGRRRRDERLWRQGWHTNWRRRSNRQRRVILWRRRWGSSEIEGRGNKGWRDDVRNGP
jgi:hypothetical protein